MSASLAKLANAHMHVLQTCLLIPCDSSMQSEQDSSCVCSHLLCRLYLMFTADRGLLTVHGNVLHGSQAHTLLFHYLHYTLGAHKSAYA